MEHEADTAAGADRLHPGNTALFLCRFFLPRRGGPFFEKKSIQKQKVMWLSPYEAAAEKLTPALLQLTACVTVHVGMSGQLPAMCVP